MHLKNLLQDRIEQYKNLPDYVVGPGLLILFVLSVMGTLYIGLSFTHG